MRPLVPVVPLLPLVLAAAACVAEVDAPVLVTGPVAALTCPARATAGVAFLVDGGASVVPPGALVELTVGAETIDALTREVTVDAPGAALARLVITDASGAASSAVCRFPVDAPPGEDGASEGEGEGEGASEGGGEGEGEGEGAPFDLTGQFAMIGYDRPELLGFPLDPGRQCAAAPSLTLVELTQDGGDVTMTSKLCHITMPTVQVWGVGLQQSSVPQRVLDALPTLGPVTFSVGDARTGAVFAPPTGAPLVRGAALASPWDALPTDPNDPRVVDGDGDLLPGVSIESTFGAREVVYRRATHAWRGVVRSSSFVDGSAEGSFRVDGEASLLSVLDLLVPTGAGLPSTFAMKRVDGLHGSDDWRGDDGALTCEDLRAHFAQLVADHPPLPPPDGCTSYDN